MKHPILPFHITERVSTKSPKTRPVPTIATESLSKTVFNLNFTLVLQKHRFSASGQNYGLHSGPTHRPIFKEGSICKSFCTEVSTKLLFWWFVRGERESGKMISFSALCCLARYLAYIDPPYMYEVWNYCKTDDFIANYWCTANVLHKFAGFSSPKR